MNSFVIQKVKLEELPSLQQICRITFVETYGAVNTKENMHSYLHNEFSLETLNKELHDPNVEHYFAVKDDTVIGYLKINLGESQTEIQQDYTLEIERIYALKEYHGKGIGQLLFDKAMEVSKAKKVDYLWLGVWEKNPRAIQFYKKNGCIEFGEHIFQLGDDEQRDVLMKLELKDIQ